MPKSTMHSQGPTPGFWASDRLRQLPVGYLRAATIHSPTCSIGWYSAKTPNPMPSHTPFRSVSSLGKAVATLLGVVAIFAFLLADVLLGISPALIGAAKENNHPR